MNYILHVTDRTNVVHRVELTALTWSDAIAAARLAFRNFVSISGRLAHE